MTILHTDKNNLQVIYEDNHLIAINKRCGDLVQGDQTGDKSLIEITKNFLIEKYNKPGNAYLGLIHRLDRPTSGAIVFSKTSKALSRMNRLFATDKVQKTYLAIVEKKPPRAQDKLTHFLKKNSAQNKSYAHQSPTPGSRKAILTYKTIAHTQDSYLLEIDLKTGRHHQIRCQLAAIGCPIKGDLKYGAPTNNPDLGISLHAKSLHFVHPVRREPITITAPLPASYKSFQA